MLGERRRCMTRLLPHEPQISGITPAQIADDRSGHGPVRGPIDDFVKIVIGTHQIRNSRCARYHIENLFRPFHICGLKIFGCRLDQIQFQFEPEGRGFFHFISVEWGDPNATIHLGDDKPLRCQLFQGFAHGRLADLEPPRNVVLPQWLIGPNRGRQNFGTQPVRYLLGDRLAGLQPI